MQSYSYVVVLNWIYGWTGLRVERLEGGPIRSLEMQPTWGDAAGKEEKDGDP